MLFTISSLPEYSISPENPEGDYHPEGIIGKTTFYTDDDSQQGISFSFVAVKKSSQLDDGQLMARYLNYPEDSMEHYIAQTELVNRGYSLHQYPVNSRDTDKGSPDQADQYRGRIQAL